MPDSRSESGPREHRFVFIGGLHRSGTSILFKCLREHPAISGFDGTGAPEEEGQHLQSVYPTALDHGGPGRFGFKAAAHLTEASPLVSEENRARLFAEWGRYWDTSKPFLLEKSPPNLIRTRFLQAMFPRSYFIVLLRHPVAVAYVTRKWSKTPLYWLLKHWLVCHEIFDADRKRLSKTLVLKYEDLVRAPDSSLQEIYGFLGVPAQPTRLGIRSEINSRYFDRWMRLRGRRDLLSRAYSSYLIDSFEERVGNFGYSLVDLERT